MDRSIIHQNSANPRRTRTLPSWLSTSASTSGTSGTESQHNSGNSSSVSVKVEFTECNDDMSLCPLPDQELVDIKPKVEAVSSSAYSNPVDIKPKVENLPLFPLIKSEPVDVKPNVEDLPSCSSTASPLADIKPKIEEIPLETEFVEGENTEFVKEDNATTMGTADSTNEDDSMETERVELVFTSFKDAKRYFKAQRNAALQNSTSNISASAASTPSIPPTSTDTSASASGSAPASASASSSSSRRMCIYRHKCYRTNPQHKKDFSHPGDEDYDGQAQCDSTSDDSASKPRCWYGSNCYRKSEEHKQKFHHSPPNSRKRNATRVQPQNTNNGDDSDAYDDSFIDDDSVEDFGASDDEETEFSDFDGSSSDEDSYPGPGRSKKKKFNIL